MSKCFCFLFLVVAVCVLNVFIVWFVILKVYGGEGWVFIEEAAYKLLIDTILEEPHELEKAPENPMLEGGSSELLESVPELYDKQVICEEQPSALDIRAPDILGKDISTGKEKSQEQDLDVKVTPTVLQVAVVFLFFFSWTSYHLLSSVSAMNVHFSDSSLT